MSRLCSSLLLSLGIVSSASAVTMDWTPIGNPGNPADTQVMTCCGAGVGTTGYGSVPYAYAIGTYEVTNVQYAEFLNAKAASDPLGLYNPFMEDDGLLGLGGITRSGSSGSYTYSAISGRGDKPVIAVSFYDALRFANWMNNGQGTGDTETGAYTITAQGIADNSITRNTGATIVLASEDEWYKAAYYDAVTTSYFDYPSGSDTPTVCASPTAVPNRANCIGAAGPAITTRGSYSGSASPYGTFDQGGNVYEWNEAIVGGSNRGLRGGTFGFPFGFLSAAVQGFDPPEDEDGGTGFRLAMIPIPEPSTGILMITGLIGLAGWRRRARA